MDSTKLQIILVSYTRLYETLKIFRKLRMAQIVYEWKIIQKISLNILSVSNPRPVFQLDFLNVVLSPSNDGWKVEESRVVISFFNP